MNTLHLYGLGDKILNIKSMYFTIMQQLDRSISMLNMNIKGTNSTNLTKKQMREDLKILKLLKKIKNKNKALLYCKHENKLIEYHCKRILKIRIYDE
jgi:hypothetical protein